jgi:hypothetical protein
LFFFGIFAAKFWKDIRRSPGDVNTICHGNGRIIKPRIAPISPIQRELLLPVPETRSAFHPLTAVIRVYDDAGNVIETQEHKGDFKEP